MNNYFKQYSYIPSSPFCLFYGDNGQDLLGNFWQCDFMITYVYNNSTLTANNVEALFQGMKYSGTPYCNQFNNQTGQRAIDTNNTLRAQGVPILHNWESEKDEIMFKLLKLSSQLPNTELYSLGLATSIWLNMLLQVGRTSIGVMVMMVVVRTSWDIC